MRFGLCTGDLETLRQLRTWGYDYAEIGARTLVPFDREPAFAVQKSRLIDSGISIEALAGFIPESVPVIGPTVDWGQVRGYVETVVSRAAEVGVRVINWGSVASRRVPPDWPMSRAWAQIEQAAGLIADAAEAAGVIVAIEAVNPREANILFYLTEAANLAQTIGRPCLRVNVDYYHCMKQNEPLAHIPAIAPYLAHAHTSDDHRQFPGLGEWDQRPFLRALRAVGYDERLSFEVHDPGNLPFAVAAQRSVAHLRAAVQEVAISESRNGT